jgi:hypothetical protein
MTIGQTGKTVDLAAVVKALDVVKNHWLHLIAADTEEDVGKAGDNIVVDAVADLMRSETSPHVS